MKRPVLRYFGGKYRLAPWIISHFPEHRVYVEPFGGAGSVLMRKDRSKVEVWNDLDDEVYNLFYIIRNGQGNQLLFQIGLTPYSRREFELSHQYHPDPLEQARRLVVRSFMGFGADSVCNKNSKTSFRSNSNQSNRMPALDWINWPEAVPQFIDRLKGVIIENRDAREVMEQHDGPETLHYIDPPYMLDTRNGRHRYRHEMDENDHRDLLEFVRRLKGKFVVSGYTHPIYEQWAKNCGLRSVQREALADGARKRTEVIWMNF